MTCGVLCICISICHICAFVHQNLDYVIFVVISDWRSRVRFGSKHLAHILCGVIIPQSETIFGRLPPANSKPLSATADTENWWDIPLHTGEAGMGRKDKTIRYPFIRSTAFNSWLYSFKTVDVSNRFRSLPRHFFLGKNNRLPLWENLTDWRHTSCMICWSCCLQL